MDSNEQSFDSQETNEMQDSQPAEDLDLEQQDAESEATDEGEVDWQAKAKELEAKNKQLYARLKKQPAKEEKKPEEKKPSKKEDELTALRGELQEIRLGQSNPTLKSEDIKKAIAYAKAEGKDPQEFIQSDFFQAYLTQRAQKEAAAKSTPHPSNRSGSSKTDFSTLSPQQISELSDSEYEKYQEHLIKTEGGSRSGLIIRRSR